MLSCDCIESAKFIHGTLSIAKLAYYRAKDQQNSMQYQRWTEGKDNDRIYKIELSKRLAGDYKIVWK